jgi:hypothetical protein
VIDPTCDSGITSGETVKNVLAGVANDDDDETAESLVADVWTK